MLSPLTQPLPKVYQKLYDKHCFGSLSSKPFFVRLLNWKRDNPANSAMPRSQLRTLIVQGFYCKLRKSLLSCSTCVFTWRTGAEMNLPRSLNVFCCGARCTKSPNFDEKFRATVEISFLEFFLRNTTVKFPISFVTLCHRIADPPLFGVT